MNKSRIAVIGTGGCGNKLLDTLLNIDNRYVSLFCNTNIREMEILDNYNKDTNALYIAGASGSGRDSKVAKELIIRDKARVGDYLKNRFSESSGINTFFIIASGDGGSGSGSVSLLTQIIKRNVNSKAKINLLIAAPKLSEKELSFANFKRLWNDIAKLIEAGMLNSIQFIDNNKMYDEEEFNYAVMKEFDDSLSINSIEIDEKDSERVNTAPGYKVTLSIDSKYKPLKMAVDNAIKNSNFILPEHLECDYMLSYLDGDVFDNSHLERLFTTYGMTKSDYHSVEDEPNIIVLGGCEMPVQYMELIEEAEMNLKIQKEERNKSRVKMVSVTIDEDDEPIIIKSEDSDEATSKSKKGKKKKMSDREFLNRLNEMDDLW